MQSHYETENISGIYIGSRGEDFKRLITGLLKKGNLKQKYIDILTTQESMDIYSAAFTSELVDEEHNYQVMEQLGDKLAGTFLVWYMYDRFPVLNCVQGVKVVARLLINYGAKQSFYKIAQDLGFWPFITATNDLRQRQMKPLLEDVFEAILGAIGRILDTQVCHGIGYAMVYKILKAIFDDMDISLKYDDLYDSKTRLKELFDMHGRELGPLVYKERKDDMITHSTVFRVAGGRYDERPDGSINMKKIVGGVYTKIGEGSAALKSDAQQKAADEALRLLNSQGYVKPPPEVYRRFAAGQDKKKIDWTVDTLVRKMGENGIDELVLTKKKTKYQSRYMSTRVAEFCRKRNRSGVEACIELKANVNIPDSDGMRPFDLLFIGQIQPKRVKKIMRRLVKSGMEMKMDRQVFDNYYVKYTDPWFTKQSIEKI